MASEGGQQAPSPDEEEESLPDERVRLGSTRSSPPVHAADRHAHSAHSSIHASVKNRLTSATTDIPHRGRTGSFVLLSSVHIHHSPGQNELPPPSSSPPSPPLVLQLLFIAIFSALGTLVREGFLYFTKKTPGWGLRPLPLFDALWPNFCGSILSALFLPLPKLLFSSPSSAERRRRKAARRKRNRTLAKEEGGGGHGAGSRAEERKTRNKKRPVKTGTGAALTGLVSRREADEKRVEVERPREDVSGSPAEKERKQRKQTHARRNDVQALNPPSRHSSPALWCPPRRSRRSRPSASLGHDLQEGSRVNCTNRRNTLFPSSGDRIAGKRLRDGRGLGGDHPSSVSSSHSVCSLLSSESLCHPPEMSSSSSLKGRGQNGSPLLPFLLAALPIGLSKGFCASLTTFSSWIFALVQAACTGGDKGGAGHPPSSHPDSTGTKVPTSNRFNQLIWIFLIGLAIPVFGFHLGTDAALFLQKAVLNQRRPKLWTFADVLRQSKELAAAEKERETEARELQMKETGETREEGERGKRRVETRGRDRDEENEEDRQECGDAGREAKEGLREERREARAPGAGQGQESGRRQELTREPGVWKSNSGKQLAFLSLGSRESVSSLHPQRAGGQEEAAKTREKDQKERGSAKGAVERKEDGEEKAPGCTRVPALEKDPRGNRLLSRATDGEIKATLVAAVVTAGVYCLFGCLAVYDKDVGRRVFLW